MFARGIDIELVPGILPVTNFARVKEFAFKCGATIPKVKVLAARASTASMKIPKPATSSPAVDEQIRVMESRREGVNAIHFYTLNRADLVYAICRTLDFRIGRRSVT